MGITTAHSDRLADVRRRLNDLRDQRAAARADVDRARQAFATATPPANGKITDSGEYHQAQRATARLNEVEAQVALAVEEESFVLGRMAGADSHLHGESFLRDPETLRSLAQVAESTAPLGRVNLGVGVARDDIVGHLGMYAAAGEGIVGNAARGSAYAGIAEAPRRALRLLDLIPTLPMDGRSVEYSREVGSLDTAQTVAEGAIKPAHTVDYDDAEAVARTIAHHTKLRKQQLADTPALEGAIRNRLAYGVLRRLEAQILSGDGIGENLRGILNTTGIATVPFSAAELAADQALEGLVAVLLSDATPNFIALNPRDWANMLKAKATGDGQYFSGGPFVATAERLWGTVTVPATGIPAGVALVGDATIGATLLVREGVSVIASDSDQDDFVRNRVTLLGEMRAALAVWQPSAFAVVDLAA
jgi:hypothetical protein